MTRFLPIFLLILAGCSSDPVIYRPVRVEVPIPVVCQAESIDPPRWPVQSLPAAASGFEILRALLVENELRKSYEIRLKAALDSCRK